MDTRRLNKKNESLYQRMDDYRLSQDDLPDGAFFQAAEDLHGFTAEDWVWFSDEYYKRNPDRKDSRMDTKGA